MSKDSMEAEFALASKEMVNQLAELKVTKSSLEKILSIEMGAEERKVMVDAIFPNGLGQAMSLVATMIDDLAVAAEMHADLQEVYTMYAQLVGSEA